MIYLQIESEMVTRIKHIYFVLVALTVVVLSSCHSSRKVTGNLTGPNPEKARFETVIQQGFKYDALQSKVKLTLGKSSLNGKMYLESGKRFSLLANAPLLGFEIGRIEASSDSVVLVDKYDKLYCVISLTDLLSVNALKGQEMEALECLVLGRIFIPGVGQASSKDYSRLSWNTTTMPDGTLGNSVGTIEGKGYRLSYYIDGQGKLVSTSLTMSDGKTAKWSYDGFQEVEKQKLIATNEGITASSGKKNINAGLILTNPSFGENSWKYFEPTASYRKVTLEELGAVLKKLM